MATRAVAVGAALGSLVAPFVLASCLASCNDRPAASDVDGGDLMGVFAHDAGLEAGADAGARRGKRRRDAGAVTPASATGSSSAPAARAPAAGVCAASTGEADHDLRRTIGRPPCRGAQVLEWKDALGSPRYACVFAPPGVETRAPLPLLVFFHDEEDDPSAVHKKTGLPKSMGDADLTGDPAHRGFIVLAVQGRHIQGGRHGSVFDTAYTGADNVDVATVDHFVGELDAKGLVDHRREFTVGASLGGHMAATYAMMRADKVAAFVAYGSDAPEASWSCAGPPPPALVVYRACDGFISCDAAERWLRARDAERAETSWLRLGAGNEEEPSCTTRNKCTPRRAEGNHHRWPKGREADMLKFLARHAFATDPDPNAARQPKPAPSGGDAGMADDEGE